MDIDSDPDPVTATYPVFLNPSLPQGRRLLVLQHPNRTDDKVRPPPTELRVKEETGMVEVDLPFVTAPGVYDREKGVTWGRSLQSSMAAKNGGSHGIAGGFGVGSAPQRGSGGAGGSAAARKKSEAQDEILEWNEAMRQGKTLTTQTLGGQFPESNDVQYMVGVFQGNNLHLTPVSSLVHLRPQLHHLDADHQLRQSSKDAGAASGTGSGAPASSTAPGGGAKAIHMTIKTTADGESVTTETMADRLRAVQTDTWRRLEHADENTDAAWEVFNDSLFLQSAVEPTEVEGEEDKVAAATSTEVKVPSYAVRWGDDDMLEAVSGMKKPEPKPEPEPEPAKKPPQPAKQKEPDVEEQKRPKATRGRGGAARASTRGARGRAASSSRGGSSAT